MRTRVVIDRCGLVAADSGMRAKGSAFLSASAGGRQRADRKALVMERGLLFAAGCYDDGAASSIEGPVGIGRQAAGGQHRPRSGGARLRLAWQQGGRDRRQWRGVEVPVWIPLVTGA